MGNPLSYETALTTLRNIEHYLTADYDALGIRKEEFELVSGPKGWLREDLRPVMRTLNALTFGTLELMGMPKIIVPAEYQAAIITACVAPGNRMAACVWLSQERQTGAGALEMSARNQTTAQMDPASADQLFALCVSLASSDSAGEARLNYALKMGIKIANSEAESYMQ